MEPLVSIVIPAYNRAGKIESAIKSIQTQTYQNWEAIIVDDGSKDNTISVIEKISQKDKRVRLACHFKNRGAQAARNTGIRSAQGEWIAFLDSDDQWLPESLALRVARAEQEKVPVIYSGAMIQHEGKPLEKYELPQWNGNIYRQIVTKEGPMFQSLLVRKDALEKINFLDENITAYQEWDTSIRLAKHFPFAFEPQATFIYDYTCTDSISRDSARAARGYLQILQKIFWDVIFFAGFRGLSYHYERISDWFSQAGNNRKAKYYKFLASCCAFLSPSTSIYKIKQIIWKARSRFLKAG